jgi:hypothetical protein
MFNFCLTLTLTLTLTFQTQCPQMLETMVVPGVTRWHTSLTGKITITKVNRKRRRTRRKKHPPPHHRVTVQAAMITMIPLVPTR